MRKKLTITIDSEVYEGLHKVIGHRRVSRFLEDLAKPHVIKSNLESSYREMATDEDREKEADEWADGLLTDTGSERTD